MYQVFESYTDSSFDVNDVCYGNGIYVAVGGEATSSPRIFTSTNTIDWTERTSGITNTTCWLKQIVYGNGIFVAVGISSDQMRRYAITSVDGINWTEAINDQGVAYHLNCVEYWDKTKQFWIGGFRATYISSDGVIWSDGPYVFPSHYANVSHTSICGAPIGICFIPMYYGNRWYVFSIDGITMPPTSEFIDSDSGLDPYKSVWDGTEIWTTLYETGCLDSYNPVTRVLTHRDISGRLVYGIAYDGKSILLVGTYYDTLNTGIYEWNGSGYNRIVNTKLKSLRGICYNTVDNIFCAVGNGIAYLIHKIYPYHKAFYNEGDEIVYAPGSTNENNGEIGTALWDMKKDNSGNVLITQTHSPGCGYWFKDDDPVVGDRGKGDKSSNVNTKWLEYKSQYPWACSKINKNTYNEGDLISSSNSPVFSINHASHTPVTTTHQPCGYWHSQKLYDPIVQMGYYSLSETSPYTDSFILEDRGLVDETLSTRVVPALGPKYGVGNSVGVSLSQTGSVSEIVLIGTNHYNVLVPRNYVSPSNQFSVMSSMYNGNYTERQLFTSPVFVVDTVAKWQIRLKIASPFLCKWIKITFPNEWGVSLNAGFWGSYYADIANIQVL